MPQWLSLLCPLEQAVSEPKTLMEHGRQTPALHSSYSHTLQIIQARGTEESLRPRESLAPPPSPRHSP